jgi:hypothetical protein
MKHLCASMSVVKTTKTSNDKLLQDESVFRRKQ